MRNTLLLVLWMFLPALSFAQETLIVTDATEELLFSEKNIRIFKDSSQSLDAKAVLLQNFTLDKVDLNDQDFETSNYWIRFTVQNNSSSNQWLLEILDFGIQKISFYDIEKDSLQQTGSSKVFKEKAYRHKNFVFTLLIPPGTSRTFLVMASSKTGFGPIMKIRSNEMFISYATKEYLLLGIYYGLLILIASYNFFLYISIRDKAHLYYIFYVAAVGLRSIQGDGLGFQYLWPSHPQINEWLNFAPQLLLICFSAYAINFLELRKRSPFNYKIILYLLIVYFCLYTINLFFATDYIHLLYLLPFFIIYGVSVKVYWQGNKTARFFVLGYSLFLFSQVFYFLISRGIRLENEILILLYVYGLNIGFVLETFIFSIALADKIKLFKQEKETAQQAIIDQLKINEELKDKVNRELELKVSERTRALEEAQTRLQKQAEEISSMNLLLDVENYKLKSNVKEINLERGLLKALSVDDFEKTFPDESTCYRFIEALKWDNGFTCYKCGNQSYVKGSDPFARRCTKCQYIETIKSNTIFHNIKFPVEKAFQMIYLILTSEKEISSYELARKLNLQQKTCLSFRQKVMDKISQKQISKQELMEKGWSILIREF